jgi:protein-tyrosine phosphatase
MTPKPSILLVCLGNICRSPLAEAAFRAEAERRGLDAVIDSAGTGGWHVGEPPDRRARATARRHGIVIESYRARQVETADFRRFDVILAMDAQNLRDLEHAAPQDATARLFLLLDFVEGREGDSVGDPYYGGPEGFERTWAEVTAGAFGFFEALGRR